MHDDTKPDSGPHHKRTSGWKHLVRTAHGRIKKYWAHASVVGAIATPAFMETPAEDVSNWNPDTVYAPLPDSVRGPMLYDKIGHKPTKPTHKAPPITISHANPDEAHASPAQLQEVIRLDDLLSRTDTLHLNDPETPHAAGGRENPYCFVWDSTAVNASDLTFDQSLGQLKYQGRVLLDWPTAQTRDSTHADNPNRKIFRDEHGVHLWVAPLNAGELPDSSAFCPLSVGAHRAHPLHYSHYYTQKNIHALLPLLPEPKNGEAFHDISTPPPDVPKNSLAYTLWHTQRCLEGAYNIMHWAPASDPSHKYTSNIPFLNLALLESSEGGIGAYNFADNKRGYVGFFQAGMKGRKLALNDAGLVDNGQWKPVKIDGNTINGPNNFMANWTAQMVFIHGFYKALVAQTKNAYAQLKAQGYDVSQFGVACSAHLTGSEATRLFAEKGIITRDGTGTPNILYLFLYSGTPDTEFKLANVNYDAGIVSKKTAPQKKQKYSLENDAITPEDGVVIVDQWAKRALKPTPTPITGVKF